MQAPSFKADGFIEVISLKECSMMIDMKRRRAKISQSLNEK